MSDPPSASRLSGGLGDIADAPEIAATLSAEDRRIVRISLTVLAILSAGSMTGVAFSLYLVEEAPLLLIGISPLGRHFVLVAPQVDPIAFLLIGTVRRLAFYTACYFLGRSLGPIALVWLEARARWFARWVRWIESLFQKSGIAVILTMAGPTTSTLAGIARMNLATFLSLATVSLIVKLAVLYEFADIFREPIEQLLGVIEQYRLPGTIVLISGIVVWQVFKRRSARTA